jgi:hypothetical protein
MSVEYEIKNNTYDFCGGNKLLEEKFGETSARKKKPKLHLIYKNKIKFTLINTNIVLM